jgi:hypothetical protein
VSIQPGGAHPGRGTRNALLGLQGTHYVEIIAPDPAQQLTGTMGSQLAALTRPRLYTFAVSCPDLETTQSRLEDVGLQMLEPVAMSRGLPDGQELSWRIAMIGDHSFGPLIPFLIDWGTSPHPSESLPSVCILEDFWISHSNSAELNKVLQAIDVPIECCEGAAGLHATLRTSAGLISLTS